VVVKQQDMMIHINTYHISTVSLAAIGMQPDSNQLADGIGGHCYEAICTRGAHREKSTSQPFRSVETTALPGCSCSMQVATEVSVDGDETTLL
jgi:hypothetical protein